MRARRRRIGRIAHGEFALSRPEFPHARRRARVRAAIARNADDEALARQGRYPHQPESREQSANAGALNRDALTQLAALERSVLDIFPDAERMRTGEILRWPGVLAESGVSPETLREAVLACGKQAIADLIDVRAREGAALATMLINNVTEMEAIVARITPLVPELIAKHQQKIVERLQDALGIAAPERPPTSRAARGNRRAHPPGSDDVRHPHRHRGRTVSASPRT